MVIDQNIQHYSYIQEDGSVVNTVAITLSHQGDTEDVFERVRNNSYIRVYVPEGSQLIEASGYDVVDSELFKEVYPGFVADEDLLRISGSSMVDAKSNTVINSELGKTVFGNWLQVDPGQSKTLTFSYRLPYRLTFASEDSNFGQILSSLGLKEASSQDAYSLLIQNQSGAKNTYFESRLYLPEKMDFDWYDSSNHEGIMITDNYLQFKTELNKDYSYGALISK